MISVLNLTGSLSYHKNMSIEKAAAREREREREGERLWWTSMLDSGYYSNIPLCDEIFVDYFLEFKIGHWDNITHTIWWCMCLSQSR